MIEDLTIEKLIGYGFSDENIEHFKSWDNYEMMFHKGLKDVYWASNKEQKIYSGKDAFRKKYFASDTIVNFPSNEPDLIPEYYKRKQSIFLKKNKEAVGQIFIELKSKERFKLKEIELTKKEIEAAKVEFESQRVQVWKQRASNHCLVMENYLDWLNELDINSIPDKNVTSIAYRVKPIDESDYFNIYILDDNLMGHYEEHLKKVNPNISLETNINELSGIFSIIEKWNDILLNERHKNAPSKEVATIEFKKELLEIIDQNDENYCNKFRRIAYNLRKKGKPVHLKGLGYLFLKYWYQTEDGEDVIKNISIVFDVKIILEALAEGTAIAEFVHAENFGTLSQTSTKIVNKIDKNTSVKETNNNLVTKTDYLKGEFKNYGFYDLEKVSALSVQNADLLLKKLIENKLPYIIAMIDYLGFTKHLSEQYYQISKDLDKKISEWFKSDKDGRAVRGNRSSLLKEHKRYTANKHKENVKKDYQDLK